MTKLRWRVKLVAEREPGVVTEAEYPEELAVILPEQAGVAIPPELAKLVTCWGDDLAAGAPAGPPRTISFPLAHATPQPFYVVPNLPVSVHGRPRVRVAPHAVAFDPETKRYYCDIAVAGLEGTYMPFLQLAIATFQRAAQQDHELSHIVLADVIQLMPDRTAVLTVAADQTAHIMLQGAAPRVSWSRSTHIGVEGQVPSVASGVATSAMVQIEQRPAATQDEFAWVAVAKPAVLSFADAPGKPVVLASPELWTGQIAIPHPTAGQPGGVAGSVATVQQEWRLAIREYEWSSEGAASQPGSTTATRLIFAEHFALPEWAAQPTSPPSTRRLQPPKTV